VSAHDPYYNTLGNASGMGINSGIGGKIKFSLKKIPYIRKLVYLCLNRK